MQHELNWLELAECLGPRSPLFRPLIEAFSAPEQIFEASEEEILEVVPRIGRAPLSAILRRRRREDAKEIQKYCAHFDIHIYPYDHPCYPGAFRELSDPPVLIYCEGRLPDFERYATVGVVGPRKADAYGESVAYKIAFEMAAAGAVIVSGLADGIDGVATAAALAAGSSTIAVLGSGINRTYPSHHIKLRKECAQCGAVITEYAPGTPPDRQNFPIRNRLISALSRAVLIVEAPEKSGSLITARYAVLQGRELFAVPGDVTSARSAGSNLLLQAGARPALCAEDVLYPLLPKYHETLSLSAMQEAQQYSELTPEIFRRFGMRSAADKAKRERGEYMKKGAQKAEEGRPVRELAEQRETVTPAKDTSLLTPRQRELYRMIPQGTFTVDVLTEQGVPVAEAAGTLTILEMYGLLGSLPGGLYEKK